MTARSFFFFQAEDGIRDVAVTGVQTCALPISVLAVAEIQEQAVEDAVAAEGVVELVDRDDLRSEEHTSELQSRLHLVCRLLLEKKKNRYATADNNHKKQRLHNT